MQLSVMDSSAGMTPRGTLLAEELQGAGYRVLQAGDRQEGLRWPHKPFPMAS